MGLDVAMATAFWRAYFAEINLHKFLAYFVDLIGLWCLGLCILVSLSIVVLRNMIPQIFSVNLWCHRWCHWLKIYEISYFSKRFSAQGYQNTQSQASQSYVHKISLMMPWQFIFDFLNPMFHCKTRHSHDWNGLKFEFALWRIDQVFLIKSIWLCWPSAQK